MATADATFPKEARLRKSLEFRHVLSQGNRTGGECFVLYWLAASPCSRIGLTVSRKVGKAVTRNRVKRVMREYFRTEVKPWPEQREYVVVAKPKAGENPNSHLRLELDRLFRHTLSAKPKRRPPSRPGTRGECEVNRDPG